MRGASRGAAVSHVDDLPAEAIAHLFRHLDDPVRLQRNPIARHLFRDPITGCLDPKRTRTAVFELRRLILDGLETAKDADLIRGRDRQAQRQYAIIQKLYFDGDPIQAVAKYLGISIRQLYRERSQICARIAAHIWRNRLPARARVPSGFTLFEFEVERAKMSAEVGNASSSYEILEALLSDCASILDKADVACTTASIAIIFGDHQVARDNIGLAKVFLERAKSEQSVPMLQELVTGRLSLVVAALRRAEGDARGAEQALSRAVEIANLSNSSRPDCARFCADVAFERAEVLLLEGQFVSASAILNSASLKAALAIIPATSRVHWQMTLAMLSLTNARYPGENPGGLDSLRDALSRARSCGSSRLALRGMHGLAVYLVHCGRFDEAVRTAKAVIEMAFHFPNTRVRAQTLVDAADVLLLTSGPSNVISLLEKADPYLHEGNVDWFGSKILLARSYNLRSAFREAWAAASAAEAVAQRLGSHRFLSAAWREIALSAYGCGKIADAAERITAAVAELEYGAPPIAALSTFKAAATITRDVRWRKRAQLLESELAAIEVS